MSDYEQWDVVRSVGLTALVVAAGRSVDTYRPDGLIDDPYAEAFVKAADPPRPMATRPVPPKDDSEDETWQMMSGYMGARTRYFDEALLAANRIGITQVVILAAGLDARAFRLDWAPDTVLFEIDQTGVLSFKDEVLAGQGAVATCDRRTVPTDLRGDWVAALKEAGFVAQRPTVWLVEGLLPYLSAAVEQTVLEAIDRLSAPGSRVAIENFSNLTEQLSDEAFRRISRSLGVDMAALLSPDKRSDPADWLAGRGWLIAVDRAIEVAAGYGRVFDALTQRLNGHSVFVDARR